jgi:predicted alpha/beta superfamily hydrolase
MKRILFFLAALLSMGTAVAQSKQPFSIGVVDHVQSKILGEERVLNIYLPEGYDKHKDSTYPVVYLLDGTANEDFIHTAGLVQYLAMYQMMPASIVVGIANVDRKRDLSFPTTNEKDKKDYPTTGGSEKFIAFIEKELQPYVEKHYRVRHDKTILGQSLGGLLAAEVLLKKPQLFTKYLMISPSLWWSDEALLKQAPALLDKQTKLNVKVYIAVGEEEQQMKDNANSFYELLQKQQAKGLRADYRFFGDENHLTIHHHAAYKGFEMLSK